MIIRTGTSVKKARTSQSVTFNATLFSLRTDNPYLTQDPLNPNIQATGGSIGKASIRPAPNAHMNRFRLLFTLDFSGMKSSILNNSIVPVSAVSMNLNFISWTNALDTTWTADLYMSPTDDSGSYGSFPKAAWDIELVAGKTNLGSYTYGTTGNQNLIIDTPTFMTQLNTAFAGTNKISFLLVNSLDAADSGNGIDPTTNKDSLCVVSTSGALNSIVLA